MKSDGKLIRVDLDLKSAFNSAKHSWLWTILEGFVVPDVRLLKAIYENSSMRIQVGGLATAAIQLDTGTVQGSTLSPLLFDLFINALLRLLVLTGISHEVKSLLEWNHQAFADDLSLYVSGEQDAQLLLDLVAKFQDWSGLKISIRKTIVTGALYGSGAAGRDRKASETGRQQATAGSKRSFSDTTVEMQEGDEQDLVIDGAVEEPRDRLAQARCRTCGKKKGPHLFGMDNPLSSCLECTHAWVPQGIRYQNELLKTVHGKTATCPMGVHYNMWLDSDSQRTKAIDGAIEVVAYLHKNEDLRIDQALKVVSMCLPPILAFSGPLVQYPAADSKTLTAIWLRAYKNAWGRSTATGLLTFPKEQGGLQAELPLGTLFDATWGNLH